MTFLQAKRGIPVTRGCRLSGIPRSSYYYHPRERQPRPTDPIVHRAVVETCLDRPSFGYRRVTAMVRRRLAKPINTKQVRRIMKLENLALEPCVQPTRARIPKQRGQQITSRPDEAYQMDLKYIWCGQDGWAYLQSVVDCCTSEWLSYAFSKRCGATQAIACLDQVVQDRFPDTCLVPATKLRVDNGPAYRSDRFTDHARETGFDVEHIQVKTPEDNGVIESLHAGLDRDYFRHAAFDSFEEARAYIQWAFDDYNQVKPQQRLDWKTPSEYRSEVTVSANQN